MSKLEDGQLLAICTAYEKGYGKGQQGRDCINPYSSEWDCDKAWQHGYDEGKSSRLREIEKQIRQLRTPVEW